MSCTWHLKDFVLSRLWLLLCLSNRRLIQRLLDMLLERSWWEWAFFIPSLLLFMLMLKFLQLLEGIMLRLLEKLDSHLNSSFFVQISKIIVLYVLVVEELSMTFEHLLMVAVLNFFEQHFIHLQGILISKQRFGWRTVACLRSCLKCFGSSMNQYFNAGSSRELIAADC